MSELKILLGEVPVPASVRPPGNWAPSNAREAVWERNTRDANEARKKAAIEKYRKAMGNEWLTLARIESRTGMSRGTVCELFLKWLERGLVERRPVGGIYCKNRGYEWRWKHEKTHAG